MADLKTEKEVRMERSERQKKKKKKKKRKGIHNGSSDEILIRILHSL